MEEIVSSIKSKRKRRKPPANKRPMGVRQINTRCAGLLVGVFMELCKRRKVSQREAMEEMLQKWCGVKLPENTRLEDII